MLGVISSLWCSVGCVRLHRHRVSRAQVVHLVFSSLPLYGSCLNQVFPHFSSVILFHFISVWLIHFHQLKSKIRLDRSSEINQTWLLKDVCCKSRAFLGSHFALSQSPVPHGKNRTFSLIHAVVVFLVMNWLPLPIILWATGNSFLLGESAELFCWLLCALSTIVLATVSHIEKILAFGISALLFSWLCAVCIQCLLCFPLSCSCINKAKLASLRSWTLHGFLGLNADVIPWVKWICISKLFGSYISSFVSFLLVNICQLMLFQECRDTWWQILVLNTVPFWLQGKTTVDLL